MNITIHKAENGFVVHRSFNVDKAIKQETWAALSTAQLLKLVKQFVEAKQL